MEREHLRVFVACGTGMPFTRLLDVAVRIHEMDGTDVFVQRGPGTDGYVRLPGAPLISRAEFSARLSWADVVVCHAGAGTLYEARQARHRPVAMARLARHREHVNDHQEELVQALAERDLVVPLEDPDSIWPAMARAREARAPSLGRSELSTAVAAALLREDSLAPGFLRGTYRILPSLVKRIRARLAAHLDARSAK